MAERAVAHRSNRVIATGGNPSVQVEGTRNRLMPLRRSTAGRQHEVIVVVEVDKGLVVSLRGDKRR